MSRLLSITGVVALTLILSACPGPNPGNDDGGGGGSSSSSSTTTIGGDEGGDTGDDGCNPACNEHHDEVCIDGECIYAPDECESDDDCAEGQHCTSDNTCGDCLSDDHCAAGQRCDLFFNVCGECTSDADCDAWESCNGEQNICEAFECLDDVNCPGGSICMNGRCGVNPII